MKQMVHPNKLASIALAGLILAACDNPAPIETVERVRAIKSYTVTERAGADQRRYSGTLVASDTSGLAFAVSGTVAAVDVNQGDQVTAGQVLARLDPEPFDLNVQAAEAEQTSAKAQFSEKENTLTRQTQLFEKGWIARAALDQAVAAYDAAEAQLNVARTRLGTAQRDKGNTVLRAPFDGVIAERAVDAFEEVQAGSPLFQINSEGALEVEMAVPDNLIERLVVGTPAIVEISSVDQCGCAAIVSEIGSASGAANTVTVKAALLSANSSLLPGMGAEVTVSLSDTSDTRGFLVPLTAIAPGDAEAQGYVFVFSPGEGIVRRIAVQGGSGVSGNFVEISEGVAAGDIVASAGVSFLRDGQAVKLLGE